MALLLLLVLAEAAPNNPGGIDGGAGPAKTPVPCFAEHASCPSVFGMNQSGCCALASPNAICCETVLVGYEIKDNFHLPLTMYCYKRSLEAFFVFVFFWLGDRVVPYLLLHVSLLRYLRLLIPTHLLASTASNTNAYPPSNCLSKARQASVSKHGLCLCEKTRTFRGGRSTPPHQCPLESR